MLSSFAQYVLKPLNFNQNQLQPFHKSLKTIQCTENYWCVLQFTELSLSIFQSDISCILQVSGNVCIVKDHIYDLCPDISTSIITVAHTITNSNPGQWGITNNKDKRASQNLFLLGLLYFLLYDTVKLNYFTFSSTTI